MAFSASKKYKFQQILFLTTNPGFVEMCLLLKKWSNAYVIMEQSELNWSISVRKKSTYETKKRQLIYFTVSSISFLHFHNFCTHTFINGIANANNLKLNNWKKKFATFNF